MTQYEGGFTDYQIALARRGLEEGSDAAERSGGSAGAGKAGGAAKSQAGAAGSAAYGQPSDSAQQVNKSNWKQRSGGEKKLKLSFKEQREFDTIEDDIAALEASIGALEDQMAACGSDYVKLQELTEEQAREKAALEEKMERWVYLTELAEKIAAQEGCGGTPLGLSG